MRGIHQILGEGPFWVAGGWIRDLALEHCPPDLDLVAAGSSDETGRSAQRLAATLGTRAHLLGRPPKAVWRIHGAEFRVEIWPLDELSPEDDARRRDFTCNAMLWRLPDGPLVDPTNGIHDLQRGLIRAVSKENLAADPVRLLRGTRLAANMTDHCIEEETFAWIRHLAPTLSSVPKERIGAEFLSLVGSDNPFTGLRLVVDLGLLGPAGPGRTSDAQTLPQSHFRLLERLAGKRSHAIPQALRASGERVLLAWAAGAWKLSSSRELASFAWPRGLAESVFNTLSSRSEACRVATSTAAHRREAIALHREDFPAVAAFAAAFEDEDCPPPPVWRRWWRQWVRSAEQILDPRPLLPAREVSNLSGLPPGPELGALLTELRRAQVRRDIRSISGARRWLRSYPTSGSSISPP